MKRLIVPILLLVISSITNAQIETPAPSPAQKITQKVGLTDITLEYSRPSMKGRTIFGSLAEYGEIWRTGANANTKLTFSTDFIIAENSLAEGSYALYTIPGEKTWEIILYTDTTNWGTPGKWDETKVAARVVVPTQKSAIDIETLTIGFDNLTNSSAVLGIMWENTYVGLKFETPTDEMVSKSILKVMNGPTANDMFGAAVFYLQTDKDMDSAQVWIDKAVEMTADAPKFWYLRQQSLIHAKAGKTKTAISAAKASLKYAKIANNGAYIKMNTASLKEWGAL
ncbi:DUF2911 domain-containing protein [Polaribacter sp.]|nr:DUF2911 domain-containing protein [Polaribacter sp.]